MNTIRFNGYTLLVYAAFFCIPLVSLNGQSLKSKPLPECKSFFVTDVGYAYAISADRPDYVITSELGLMVNISPKYAIGLAHCFEGDNVNPRSGFKALFRRWIDSKLSVDFGAGLNLWEDDGNGKTPSLTTHLSLNLNHWFAITTRLSLPRSEEFEYRNENNVRFFRVSKGIKTNANWYFGITLGSSTGAVIHAAAAVLAAIVFATWDGEF